MDSNADLIKKLRAIDNATKLDILKYLVNEGAKSITDISKELKINFSTAHKYLEGLEKAGLIKSKQEIHNRLKRVFYVNSFNIELSPAKLSSARKETAEAPSFEIILNDGSITQFNENEFIKEYIELGLPQKTIDNTLDMIYNHIYDKITLIELKSLFEKTLIDRMTVIESSLKNLVKKQSKKRTYFTFLSAIEPQAIEKHMNGTIFIQNLGEPILLNFVHDIRGISVHKIKEKTPKNLDFFLSSIEEAVKMTVEHVKQNHLIDSFNYFIAPFVEGLSEIEIKRKIAEFFEKIMIPDIKIYVSLEIGIPRFSKNLPIEYYGGKTYSEFSKTANKIIPLILEEITNIQGVVPILKIWDKNANLDCSNLNTYYVANMLPKWQKENASYCGMNARFDSEWKGWIRSVRVGEIQNIAINIPAIALESKTKEEFILKLKKELIEVINYLELVSELFLNPAITKKTVNLDSNITKRWSYFQIQDCVYSLALAGINSAAEILKQDKKRISMEIIKTAKKIIEENKGILRIQLKEESSPQILERFKEINLRKHKSELGENIKSDFDNEESHYLLDGGHVCFFDKKEFDIKSFLDSKGGLAYVY